MPYRKSKRSLRSRLSKRRKSYRVRFSRKRSTMSKLSSMKIRNPNVISDRVRVKLPYKVSFSYAGTPIDVNCFRGNSCFDPDFQVGGQQPTGFDEWAAFYNKYRVLGSSITLDVANTSSTIPANVVVFPTNLGAYAGTDVDDVLSVPYAKSVLLGIAAGSSRNRIKHYISTRKLNGMKSIEFEDDFAAVTTTNPVDEWYWNIVNASGDGTSASTIMGQVKLTYYVEFFDRKYLTQS